MDSLERLNLLDRYNVDYIYCPITQDACVDLEGLNRLSLILRNGTYNIYSISQRECIKKQR